MKFHPNMFTLKEVVTFIKSYSCLLAFWKFDNLINDLAAVVVTFQGGALYVSMLPTEALQARVLTDVIAEFKESRFACITTESTRDDSLFSYLSQYLSSNGPQAASPRCIILNSDTLLKELSASLAAISASGIRLIVVHCTSVESPEIIFLIRKLNFKILKGDFVWIFTDIAIGEEATEFPRDSIGIQKAQTTGNNSMLEFYKGLLNDSVKLFVQGLERSLEGLSHSTRQKCLGGEIFAPYKRRLYR